MKRDWTLHDDIVRPDGTVPDIDRTPSPYWNNATSAATGRHQCGGPEPDGGDNHRQPVIGQHKDCGPRDGVTSTSRESGQLSLVGTFHGVPIYAHDSMDCDQTLYAVGMEHAP